MADADEPVVRHNDLSRDTSRRPPRRHDVTGSRERRRAGESWRGSIISASFNDSDHQSTSYRSTLTCGRKAHETFTNVGESPSSELEEYRSDDDNQRADETHTEVHSQCSQFFRSSRPM